MFNYKIVFRNILNDVSQQKKGRYFSTHIYLL